VLGLLAKRLPKNEQPKALLYGLAGAFIFRFIAVLTASLLLQWTFVKFLGGAYLVYIGVRHLFFESKETEEEKIVLDEHGHPKLVEEDTGGELTEEQEELEIKERVPVYMTAKRRRELGLASFWPTVFVIELTDIAFAVDSILAALAMVGSPPPGHSPDAFHPKLWVVILGGLLGLILMRFAARAFIWLLEKFPRFEITAYLLVIVIGLKLLADWGVNSDWSFRKPAWVANRLGAWRQTFQDLEDRRLGLVHRYEDWLRDSWPLGLAEHKHAEKPHELPAATDGANGPPPQPPPKEAEEDSLYVPHLLDFHGPRRPEFIAFWSIMLICFFYGFIPKRESKSEMTT
jgi:YkoY family integral membrane protein